LERQAATPHCHSSVLRKWPKQVDDTVPVAPWDVVIGSGNDLDIETGPCRHSREIVGVFDRHEVVDRAMQAMYGNGQVCESSRLREQPFAKRQDLFVTRPDVRRNQGSDQGGRCQPLEPESTLMRRVERGCEQDARSNPLVMPSGHLEGDGTTEGMPNDDQRSVGCDLVQGRRNTRALGRDAAAACTGR